MNAVLPASSEADGRSRVALAELIALRGRLGRVRSEPRPSRAARSGQQASPLHGRGMDYAESRAYQPGDDVRRLDWRLTARSGKLHTKLYQEDREGCLLILLDSHPSMRFGTRERFKSVQAARAAACAAWYAARAGERVGLLAFGNGERWLRPAAGARGALAVCGALARWDVPQVEAAPEPLAEALQRAGRALHGANRLLLISDGFSSDATARQRLLELKRQLAPSVLVVADALELAAPPPGRYPLEHDGERHDVLLLSAHQRQGFHAAMGAGPARLAGLAQAAGLPCQTIDTSADPMSVITRLLSGRRPGR